MKKILLLLILLIISINILSNISPGILNDNEKKENLKESYIQFYLDNREDLNKKAFSLFTEYKITVEYNDEYGIYRCFDGRKPRSL